MAMKRADPASELPCDHSEGEALIEADGESLSEASRVDASESATSCMSRTGIGGDEAGVESTPPSE
eukprot:scaffold36183_cov56-Phaeocystis_antarctica.AAC.5